MFGQEAVVLSGWEGLVLTDEARRSFTPGVLFRVCAGEGRLESLCSYQALKSALLLGMLWQDRCQLS